MNFRLPNIHEAVREAQTLVAPAIAYQGREFSGTGDFDNLRLRFSGVALGGAAFSVGFTARWESLQRWSRVIDFGDGPGRSNIIIGNRGHEDTLVFNVWVNSKEYGLHIPKAIVVGETHRYLCTVTPAGHMEVYREGELIGETNKGAAPSKDPRRFLYVGGSNWNRDDGFHGLIADLAIWNTLVDWNGKEREYERIALPVQEEQASAELEGPVLVGPAAPGPAFVQPSARSQVKEPEPKVASKPRLVRKLDLAARGPTLSYQGRAFGGEHDDYEDLAKKSGPLFVGEAFSVAFTARWDSLNGWSRILDFASGPEKGNIFIGNRGVTGTFVFHVWIEDADGEKREWRVQAADVIKVGETHRYLCTMSADGHMQAFKDGDLIAQWQAVPIKKGPRKRLFVAKSQWSRDQPFHGAIHNLGFWDEVMHWKDTLQVSRFGFSGKAIVVDLAELDRDQAQFEGLEWLESRMRACLPVGWGVHWHHGIEYQPALMHFVGEDTALLLRTHRSKGYLPAAVLRALQSENLTKVTTSFDEKHQGWVQHAFEVEPLGVVNLVRLAGQKGLPDTDLTSLADAFGMGAHRSAPGGGVSWVSTELTDGQIRYVADDAHLNCLLLEKIWHLPDAETATGANAVPLVLKQDWVPQRIVLKGNAFWCAACDKGPMMGATNVEIHLQSSKHQKRLQELHLQEEGLSEDYLAQGIVVKSDAEGRRSGAYRCLFCNIGALADIGMVDAHIRSKGHQKAVAQAVVPASAGPAPAPADPFELGRWNLPDYVQEANGQLVCTLCSISAGSLLQMQTHLGGDKHARRCRGMGREELIFVRESSRLEIRATGCPVIRSGFAQPNQTALQGGASPGLAAVGQAAGAPAQQQQQQQSQQQQHQQQQPQQEQQGSHDAPQPAAKTGTAAKVLAMLPPGWRAVWHPESGKHYYADIETQTSQWRPPPAYHDQGWMKKIDPGGRAFWTSGKLGVTFFEESSGEWRRLADEEGRIYWSNGNAEKSIRFFECLDDNMVSVAPNGE